MIGLEEGNTSAMSRFSYFIIKTFLSDFAYFRLWNVAHPIQAYSRQLSVFRNQTDQPLETVHNQTHNQTDRPTTYWVFTTVHKTTRPTRPDQTKPTNHLKQYRRLQMSMPTRGPIVLLSYWPLAWVCVQEFFKSQWVSRKTHRLLHSSVTGILWRVPDLKLGTHLISFELQSPKPVT